MLNAFYSFIVYSSRDLFDLLIGYKKQILIV